MAKDLDITDLRSQSSVAANKGRDASPSLSAEINADIAIRSSRASTDAASPAADDQAPIVVAMLSHRGGHSNSRHEREDEPKRGKGSHAHHTSKSESNDDHGGGDKSFNRYWNRVTAARSKGQYLSEYPPVYPGIDKPRPIQIEGEYMPKQGTLPSLQDLITSSKDLNRAAFQDKKQPDFNLLSLDENTFKQRYVHEALHVGSRFGMNNSQMQEIVQRIYAFEDGGWGTYQTLSNMPEWMTADAKSAQRLPFHPGSTAIGYNQLLMLDTIRNIEFHSTEIAARLEELAKENSDPQRSQQLEEKAKLVRGVHAELDRELMAMAHKNKGHYLDGGQPTEALFAAFAKEGGLPKVGMSPKKMACAVQALNLDGDIGPVIQSQELGNLLQFQKDANFHQLLEQRSETARLDAAKFDALPQDKKAAAVDEIMRKMRLVPTEGKATTPEDDKAFQETRDLLTKRLSQLGPGLSDALSRDKFSDAEFSMFNMQVLTQRRFGGEFGPLSQNARAFLDKVTYVYFGGPSPETLMPPALELANLAGTVKAQRMLTPENVNLPTSNFFQKDGYQRNPVTSRRSAGELLWSIDRIMHGPNASLTKPGNAAFSDSFKTESKPGN